MFILGVVKINIGPKFTRDVTDISALTKDGERQLYFHDGLHTVNGTKMFKEDLGYLSILFIRI